MKRVLFPAILVALAVLSSACGSSDVELHLWGPELRNPSVAALVRVELKGGGMWAWVRVPTHLSGAAAGAVSGRFPPVAVPTLGTLLVRVALVTPAGDTLARSGWDTVRLERSYNYWVAVAVADSSGPHYMCSPRFTGYPVQPNRLGLGDSLFVEVTGMPKGSIC